MDVPIFCRLLHGHQLQVTHTVEEHEMNIGKDFLLCFIQASIVLLNQEYHKLDDTKCSHCKRKKKNSVSIISTTTPYPFILTCVVTIARRRVVSSTIVH